MTDDRETLAFVHAATNVVRIFNRLDQDTLMPRKLCLAIEELDTVLTGYRSRRNQAPINPDHGKQ